jgi:predicted CoA-binding protein
VECRKIAVVGLSSNPARPSYRVAAYMQQQGKVVIPVNPRESACWGNGLIRHCLQYPVRVEMVTIFPPI